MNLVDILKQKVDPSKITVIDLYNGWAGSCVPLEQYILKLENVAFLKIEISSLKGVEKLLNDAAPHIAVLKDGICTFYMRDLHSGAIDKELEKLRKNVVEAFVGLPFELDMGPITTPTLKSLLPYLLVIKPDSIHLKEAIEKQMLVKHIQIDSTTYHWCTSEVITSLYPNTCHTSYFPSFQQYMCAGPCLVLHLKCLPQDLTTIVDILRKEYSKNLLHNTVCQFEATELVVSQFNSCKIRNQIFSNTIQSTLLAVWNSTNSDRYAIESTIKHLGLSIQKSMEMALTENQLDYFLHSEEITIKNQTYFYQIEGMNAIDMIKLFNPPQEDLSTHSVLNKLNNSKTEENQVYIFTSTVESYSTDIQIIESDFTGLEKCLFVFKPQSKQYEQHIHNALTNNHFEVMLSKEIQFNDELVDQLYIKLKDLEFYKEFKQWMQSEPLLCLIVQKVNVIRDLKQLLGPKDKTSAIATHPESLRAIYSDYDCYWKNCAHCSDIGDNSEIKLVFGDVDLKGLTVLE